MSRPPEGPPKLPQRYGQDSETLALSYLQKRGMKLVRRNFSVHRLGEIDLIMRTTSQLHPRLLVFVEVRYRRSARFGGAAASVTAAKRHRLQRTASAFQQAARRYRQWPSRFDVVAITGSLTNAQVTWIKNAFEC